MIRKLIATIPAGLGALFMAACGDSEPQLPAFPQAPSPKVEYRQPAPAPTYAVEKEAYKDGDDEAEEGLTQEQMQYVAALQRARYAQQLRQARVAQYYRQMIAAQMIRNAYAQQQGGGYGGSTGSYRRPGSTFSTYDHTGTSAYTDSSGSVVGVMTPNGSWYPGQ